MQLTILTNNAWQVNKKKEREREKSENKVEMKNIDCKKKEIGLKDEISWAMH